MCSLLFVVLFISNCAGSKTISRGIHLASNTRLIQQGLDKEVMLYRRSHAILIGIDDYQNWGKLDGAVRDAKAMAEVLTNHNTSITLILNQDAT